MNGKGKIRVGTSKYINKKLVLPTYKDYTSIIVLTTRYSKYGDIGPYNLKNEKGQIVECVWQFSKVYKYVPESKIPYSSGDRRIVWNWPKETHIDDDGNLTPEYWNWRETGKNNELPVRNPVPWYHLKNCQFSLEKDLPISKDNPKLDYIQARKKIYLPIYINAVKSHELFKELQTRYNNGEKILIIEVDGPHSESLNYYIEKYNVEKDFIKNDSMLATLENLNIMLNDGKYPFGHGYALAWAIQEFDFSFE